MTADANMVGGGGGWTEAADRAGAITVAVAAANDGDADRECVTGGASAKAAARVGYGARATRGECWIAQLMAGSGRTAVAAAGQQQRHKQQEDGGREAQQGRRSKKEQTGA